MVILMEREPININDPKTYSRAKGVATRRNNAARKKLEAERARLPLLADQLPTVSDLPVVTPEQVVEKRLANREAAAEWRANFAAMQARHLSDRIARIAALVSDTEFAEIEQEVARCSFGAEVGWGIAEIRIKRRLEPMTDNEVVVLALLCNQDKDKTVDELHRSCGDGMSRADMLKALLDLQSRGLAGGGRLRLCAVTGNDGAPWEATIAGRELINEESLSVNGPLFT